MIAVVIGVIYSIVIILRNDVIIHSFIMVISINYLNV